MNYCNSELVTWFNGALYVEAEGFHNIFRKGGYPDDILTSYKETLDYIATNTDSNCKIYETTIERLKEFWTKYPDGLIKFG